MMNNRNSSMQGLAFGAIVFSLVFAAACACVVIFFPSEMKAEESPLPVVTESIEVETEPYYFEIEDCVREAVFTNSDLVSHAEIEQQVMELKVKADEGLEFYREPQTRGAVEWFYTHLTGDRDVALAILNNAEQYEIPLSLAFSLAYIESSYNPNAKHVNTNNSVDRGLFQLNNESFPDLSEAQFYDPYVSARYGLSHLKFCLSSSGNEVTALAMYNAGSMKVRRNSTPQTTLNYIAQIQNYRSVIEANFQSEVVAFCSQGMLYGKEELLASR